MVKYKQEMEEYAAKKGTTITVNLDDIADLTGGVGDSVSPAPVMKTAPSAAAKPAPKRRKTGKENGAAVAVIATNSPVPLPIAAKAAPAASTPAKAEKKEKKKKEDSPEDSRKKRSRKSKGGDDAEEGAAEGEKKERKRKRKTDNA
jgi:hypothetical protein